MRCWYIDLKQLETEGVNKEVLEGSIIKLVGKKVSGFLSSSVLGIAPFFCAVKFIQMRFLS